MTKIRTPIYYRDLADNLKSPSFLGDVMFEMGEKDSDITIGYYLSDKELKEVNDDE